MFLQTYSTISEFCKMLHLPKFSFLQTLLKCVPSENPVEEIHGKTPHRLNTCIFTTYEKFKTMQNLMAFGGFL